MGLLERDASLRELTAALNDAISGSGRVILISGEAGVGKTALVQQFTHARPGAVRLLWGDCDALYTPRPLGPLYDMFIQEMDERPNRRGSVLPALLLQPDANRAEVFASVIQDLRARPAVVVFEDVHWADEATLDLLKFLSRRISRTRALLILTYRDDEIGARHPLRTLLGDLASLSDARRIQLEPLSPAAVATLVGDRGLDAGALYLRTGGNPFFVTEVLAAVGDLPPTIRDAVLARAARISAGAQDVLWAAAVIGARVEPEALAEVAGARAAGGPIGTPASERWAALEECLDSGVLLAQSDYLAFRHELARETILASMPATVRAGLHRRTLAVLRELPATRDNLARLAHHAEAAGDGAAVLEFAPRAARQSSAANAHRAAAAFYQMALQYEASLAPQELADILEAYGQECHLIDRRAEGVGICRRVIALRHELGDAIGEGRAWSQLSSMLIGVGHNAEAEQSANAAVALLESQTPTPELAHAYRMRATQYFLDHKYEASIALANRALELAQSFDDGPESQSTRNIIGSAMLFIDYERGAEELLSSFAAARAAGRDATAAHALTNLGSASCELFHLRRAERYLEEGIAFAGDRDLDRLRLYMLAWQAMTHLRLGRWDEALVTAENVLNFPGVSVPSRITALVAQGLVCARRGEWATSAVALDEALTLSSEIASLHRIGLVRAARAEAAWLSGDMTTSSAEARAVLDLAIDKRHPWFAGELLFWVRRAEEATGTLTDDVLPEWIAAPYHAEIAGNWPAAAEAWKQLRCPYETARALAAGNEAAKLDALRRFELLGARPAGDSLREELQAGGVAHIPRGPRLNTRENPFGLTSRQMEIASLLAESLTNAQIADRLHISPKTADHHVSAVLAKMDVHTRGAAAELMRDSGLLSAPPDS